MTFRLPHLIAALVLHALVLGLLFGGVQCSPKVTRPPVIRAVLLDPDRKEVVQNKRAEEKRRQEQKRKLEEDKRKREDEARRVAAEQTQREALATRQKQADEAKRKKAEELQRQKELADQKKAEDLARKKKEQEEQRDRQEQAQREIQEKARMEEAMRSEATQRETAREQAAREQAERESMQSEWGDQLSRHVQKYWIRPGSAAAEFECEVRVQLLPDGSVTSAKISKSCGNPMLDRSVEDAVLRSSPMPRPSNPLAFDRDLYITFVPGPR
jgi:colicin import membrane protein